MFKRKKHTNNKPSKKRKEKKWREREFKKTTKNIEKFPAKYIQFVKVTYKLISKQTNNIMDK